jgi:hypothetical protein
MGHEGVFHVLRLCLVLSWSWQEQRLGFNGENQVTETSRPNSLPFPRINNCEKVVNYDTLFICIAWHEMKLLNYMQGLNLASLWPFLLCYIHQHSVCVYGCVLCCNNISYLSYLISCCLCIWFLLKLYTLLWNAVNRPKTVSPFLLTGRGGSRNILMGCQWGTKNRSWVAMGNQQIVSQIPLKIGLNYNQLLICMCPNWLK